MISQISYEAVGYGRYGLRTILPAFQAFMSEAHSHSFSIPVKPRNQ